MDLSALQKTLREFAAERNWQPFHTPKNLATALMVEAAELVEIFQWMTPEQSQAAHHDHVTQERISDEVADVLLYLLQVADHSAVDLKRAVGRKLVKNAKKHPPVKPGVPVGPSVAALPQTHVLVDWENVQPKDADIRALVPDVTDVWLFHGPNQKRVDKDQESFGDRVTLVPISRTGKNALDFHLSFYMGYIASRNPAARFVVLSNDQGYGPMLHHAVDLGFSATLVGFVKGGARSGSQRQPRQAASRGGASRRAPAREVAPREASSRRGGGRDGTARDGAPRHAQARPAAGGPEPVRNGAVNQQPARQAAPARDGRRRQAAPEPVREVPAQLEAPADLVPTASATAASAPAVTAAEAPKVAAKKSRRRTPAAAATAPLPTPAPETAVPVTPPDAQVTVAVEEAAPAKRTTAAKKAPRAAAKKVARKKVAAADVPDASAVTADVSSPATPSTDATPSEGAAAAPGAKRRPAAKKAAAAKTARKSAAPTEPAALVVPAKKQTRKAPARSAASAVPAAEEAPAPRPAVQPAPAPSPRRSAPAAEAVRTTAPSPVTVPAPAEARAPQRGAARPSQPPVFNLERALQHVQASLRKTANKPARRPRLLATIRSLLGQAADEASTQAVLDRLLSSGQVTIDGKGAVGYAL